MKGKVKFYNRHKGFGFITAENGKEYFFNATSINLPREDDAVDFEVQQTPKGEAAKSVTLGGESSGAGAACKTKSCAKSGLCIVGFVVVLIVGILIGHFVK